MGIYGMTIHGGLGYKPDKRHTWATIDADRQTSGRLDQVVIGKAHNIVWVPVDDKKSMSVQDFRVLR